MAVSDGSLKLYDELRALRNQEEVYRSLAGAGTDCFRPTQDTKWMTMRQLYCVSDWGGSVDTHDTQFPVANAGRVGLGAAGTRRPPNWTKSRTFALRFKLEY